MEKDDSLTVLAHSIINGWIRALFSAISGWLISKGIVDATTGAQLTQILMPAVSGIVLLVGTGLWSMAEKRMHALLPPPVASQPMVLASGPGVNPPTG